MTNATDYRQTIGIIGGGQLGKMLAQAAKQRGHQVIILDPTPNCPAAQVSDSQIEAEYDDQNAMKKLAAACDKITYEFENIDKEAAEAILTPEVFPQGLTSLAKNQDRLIEKAEIQSLGLKTVPWEKVTQLNELNEALEKIGYPAVLKTTRFGYDGKGQYVIKAKQDIEKAQELLTSGPCILEGWLDFDYEASLIIGRNSSGDTTLFPIGKNTHVNNILHLSEAGDTSISDAVISEIHQAGEKLAHHLELVGVMGVEFFIKDNQVYVNEIAPRPHNSGHWTIEACPLSQFDIHIKALLNEPLPKRIPLFKPAVLVNILGQHLEGANRLLTQNEYCLWSFHDYGKAEARENRKMGHFTIIGDSLEEIKEAIAATQIWS